MGRNLLDKRENLMPGREIQYFRVCKRGETTQKTGCTPVGVDPHTSKSDTVKSGYDPTVHPGSYSPKAGRINSTLEEINNQWGRVGEEATSEIGGSTNSARAAVMISTLKDMPLPEMREDIMSPLMRWSIGKPVESIRLVKKIVQKEKHRKEQEEGGCCPSCFRSFDSDYLQQISKRIQEQEDPEWYIQVAAQSIDEMQDVEKGLEIAEQVIKSNPKSPWREKHDYRDMDKLPEFSALPAFRILTFADPSTGKSKVGQPCKRGWSVEKTGCTPKKKEEVSPEKEEGVAPEKEDKLLPAEEEDIAQRKRSSRREEIRIKKYEDTTDRDLDSLAIIERSKIRDWEDEALESGESLSPEQRAVARKELFDLNIEIERRTGKNLPAWAWHGNVDEPSQRKEEVTEEVTEEVVEKPPTAYAGSDDELDDQADKDHWGDDGLLKKVPEDGDGLKSFANRASSDQIDAVTSTMNDSLEDNKVSEEDLNFEEKKTSVRQEMEESGLHSHRDAGRIAKLRRVVGSYMSGKMPNYVKQKMGEGKRRQNLKEAYIKKRMDSKWASNSGKAPSPEEHQQIVKDAEDKYPSKLKEGSKWTRDQVLSVLLPADRGVAVKSVDEGERRDVGVPRGGVSGGVASGKIASEVEEFLDVLNGSIQK